MKINIQYWYRTSDKLRVVNARIYSPESITHYSIIICFQNLQAIDLGRKECQMHLQSVSDYFW